MTASNASVAGSASSPMARRIPAWLVPLALVAGLFLIVVAVAWPALRPATPVRVVAAAAASGSGATSADAGEAVVVQAAGWIEPDPQPVVVSALVPGVVVAIHAREGEAVRAGQPLLSLDDRDARLDLRDAEARRDEARARLEAAEAAVTVQVARVAVEQSRLAEARAQVDRVSAAGPALPGGDLRQARLRVEAQAATVAALEAEAPVVAAGRAEAAAVAAGALVARDRAALALERCVIPAPIDGLLMRLHAAIGQRVGPEQASLAECYDPARVQVRIDVPLAETSKLVPGQTCRILVEPWPEHVFTGTLVRVVGAADLARNTLQAKIRIEDPLPGLRPEMLARVRVLAAPPTGATGTTNTAALGVWAPAEGVRDGSIIWTVGLDQRLERRPVTTGARREGWIEILSGLRLGEPVVVGGVGLAIGDRVDPRFEDG